jgi:hypothetical protein
VRFNSSRSIGLAEIGEVSAEADATVFDFGGASSRCSFVLDAEALVRLAASSQIRGLWPASGRARAALRSSCRPSFDRA